MITFCLRAETKSYEKRTALTPENAGKLLHTSNCKIFVEKSTDRIFEDALYEEVGCELVETGSWQDAPADCFILGLKEIPPGSFPLKHKHIYFAHVYKGQEGAEEVLHRFQEGKGLLFDLEFLMDEKQRRVAAFGKWAGFAGTSIALDHFYNLATGGPEVYPPLHYYPSSKELIKIISEKKLRSSVHPKVIVIGAKGRCGGGASLALQSLGLSATGWDYEETKKGGPFTEIAKHDIFINTVLLSKKIPPFVDKSILDKKVSLRIISDVSCDPNSEVNPIPLYDKVADWEKPFIQLKYGLNQVDILAVDNLPSLLPRESSIDFSNQLSPHLLDLARENYEALPVWQGALEFFYKRLEL